MCAADTPIVLIVCRTSALYIQSSVFKSFEFEAICSGEKVQARM